MDQLISLLPLLAIVVLFWLLVLRPAQRRQKETAAMQAALEPGQRVMLASGLFATIVSLRDDRAVVTIAPGVDVEIVRAAIQGNDKRDGAATEGPVDGPTTSEA